MATMSICINDNKLRYSSESESEEDDQEHKPLNFRGLPDMYFSLEGVDLEEIE